MRPSKVDYSMAADKLGLHSCVCVCVHVCAHVQYVCDQGVAVVLSQLQVQETQEAKVTKAKQRGSKCNSSFSRTPLPPSLLRFFILGRGFILWLSALYLMSQLGEATKILYAATV